MCTDVIFYPGDQGGDRGICKQWCPRIKQEATAPAAWGAYVKGIRGDYNNVVGLPVARLIYETKKIGINLKG